MFTRILLTTALSLGLSTAFAVPASNRQVMIDSARFSTLTADEQAHVLDLKQRLEDILTTDRSELDRTERKALRQEWRSLKSEMDAVNRDGTTIYISTAGLIIIILLLIILL